MRQIINEDGKIIDPENEPKLSKKELLKIYKTMVQLRLLNDKSFKLQRQGRIAFHVPVKGQEAHVGVAAALQDKDWVIPAYREHGIALYRDYPIKNIINHFFANQLDPQKGRRLPGLFGDNKIHFVNPSAPIGTQIIHAVGTGYASKYKKDGVVSVVFFGDGATSSNDFHSGMNFGGVFKTPTIFFCQNNHYAISLPVSRQTAAKELVDKAVGYGIPGIAVDGNDVLTIYATVKEAAERARKGEGPTFIESRTYRLGAHTSSDDPTKYRSEEELKKWQKRDPILRFKIYLMDKGILTKEKDKKIIEEYDKELSQIIKDAESIPKPNTKTMFDDVYEELPWHLEEQKEYALSFKETGD